MIKSLTEPPSCPLFYIFANLFNAWHGGRLLILLSSATYILLQCVVECKLGLKTVWGHIDRLLKKIHSSAFSENHEYSSLLHLNWRRVSFCQVSCKWDPQRSRYYTSFPWYLLHSPCIFYPCVISGHPWKILVHCACVGLLNHFIIRDRNPMFINIPTDLIRRVLQFWETVKPVMAYTSVLEFSFLFASLNFIIGTKRGGRFS